MITAIKIIAAARIANIRKSINISFVIFLWNFIAYEFSVPVKWKDSDQFIRYTCSLTNGGFNLTTGRF